MLHGRTAYSVGVGSAAHWVLHTELSPNRGMCHMLCARVTVGRGLLRSVAAASVRAAADLHWSTRGELGRPSRNAARRMLQDRRSNGPARCGDVWTSEGAPEFSTFLECVPLTWLQAVVLAVVQGLTEFLPISSSGHLRIVSQLFFDADAGASFTAVTQIGTELAVVLYFMGDIVRLAGTWFRGLVNAEVRQTQDYRLAWYVIVGSIPIGILGFFFQDLIRGALRSLWITATTLIVFGLLLGLAEKYGPQLRTQKNLRMRDGVLMGLAQSLALVPGVSRSGGTITAGLSLGLDRTTAVRFSFLLAIPAVFAAGLLELTHVFDSGGPGLQPSGAQMLVATVLAGVVGYACIAWLLRYVQRHSVYLFVWWRVGVGLAVYALLTFGVLQA